MNIINNGMKKSNTFDRILHEIEKFEFFHVNSGDDFYISKCWNTKQCIIF